MGRQTALPRKISKFIQKHDLAKKNQLLVVGVSGGPDSVCLLHILVKLQEELDNVTSDQGSNESELQGSSVNEETDEKASD